MKSVPPRGSGWVSVSFRSIIKVGRVISLTGYPHAYWATFLVGLFAYKRKIALHRQWATRSYAIALVFIAGRFVMGVTGWEALGVEIVQAIIWSRLALSVPLADIAIHWKVVLL